MGFELKAGFIKEIQEALEKGRFIRVKDFAEEYGLK
jgi:hypothetical protein